MFIGAFDAPLPRCLFLHASQVVYQFWSGWRQATRMQKVLKDMPATKGEGHDRPMGWLKDLKANMLRSHDWRLDRSGSSELQIRSNRN